MESYNKKDFAGRVQQILGHYKTNANKVAKVLGINNVNIYQMTNEESDQLPNMRLIMLFLNEFPDIDYRWFLSGQGRMLKSSIKKQDQPATSWEEFAILLDEVESLIHHNKNEHWKILRVRLEKSYMYFGEEIRRLYGSTEKLRLAIDELRQ